jgi:uncharacterized coiled-coil DUF342 family protein
MPSDDIVARLRRFTANNADWPTIAEAADEIERLRDELARNADECAYTLTELRERVKTLTAERDEARREVCARFALIYSMTVQEVEKLRGWNCFKEER